MNPRRFLAAAVQMSSGEDVATNLAAAERLTEQAARQGAMLVALPEMFPCLGRREANLAAAQDVPNRRLDLRLDLLVLTRQVELRNLHWNPVNPRPKPYCPSSSRLMLMRNSSSSTRSMKAAVMPQHCSRKSTSRRFSMTVPVSIL